MEFIDESVPFEDTEWRTSVSATPAFTLQVVYRQREEVLCFGVKARAAALGPGPVRDMIAAVETQYPLIGFAGDHGIVPARVLAFDALGHLAGEHRRFTNGWANEIGARVVHIFPCFQCELTGDWSTPQFAAAVRSFDVFDVTRAPVPFVEIQMRGGKSQLLVEKWECTPLRSVLTYADILSAEPEGVLQIRNMWGEVAKFDQAGGWEDYAKRISAHVSQRRVS